jgi:hypothetical protein
LPYRDRLENSAPTHPLEEPASYEEASRKYWAMVRPDQFFLEHTGDG